MKNWSPPGHRFRDWLLGTRVHLRHFDDWHSSHLNRNVRVDIYLPPGFRQGALAQYPLLLLNDGQDLPFVRLQPTLEQLYQQKIIPHLVVAGIHAGEARIREYGTAGRPDYKGRGDLATGYRAFILEELLPWIRTEFQVSTDSRTTAFGGFSLGGLSALDIAWSNPEVFGAAGVFSGALWWRSHEVRPEDPDADRIMHDMVLSAPGRPNAQRFWFQAGTCDETEDRNHNGVIDAIDDTLHLMDCLRTIGYPEAQMAYLEMEGGEHNPATWARAMPEFLKWVYG